MDSYIMEEHGLVYERVILFQNFIFSSHIHGIIATMFDLRENLQIVDLECSIS